MIPVKKKYIILRVIVVGAIFSLFFSIIGAKAVYLQIFCRPWLSQKAADQYEVSLKFSGKRGTIYDKNLKEMAVSIDLSSIAAHPSQIKNVHSIAKPLAKVLKIDRKVLKKKLSANKKFVWIKRQVTPKEAEAVRKLKIAGLDFIPERKRFYPNRSLAAQILGFTDIDDQGLEGIEFYYDAYLKEATSKITVLKDALGRGFNAEKRVGLNNSGNNLVLTIDRTIQYIAEKAALQCNVLVAPTIKLTISHGHIDFPGTLIVQPETLIQVIVDMCLCLSQHGFKKIILSNYHGPNRDSINVAIIKLKNDLPDTIIGQAYAGVMPKECEDILEDNIRGHADEGITSKTLAIVPDLVTMDRSKKEYPVSSSNLFAFIE